MAIVEEFENDQNSNFAGECLIYQKLNSINSTPLDYATKLRSRHNSVSSSTSDEMQYSSPISSDDELYDSQCFLKGLTSNVSKKDFIYF